MRKNPSLLGYIWQHSDQWVECVLAETGTTIIDRTRARSLIGIFIECIASWSEPRDFPTTAWPPGAVNSDHPSNSRAASEFTAPERSLLAKTAFKNLQEVLLTAEVVGS